jgi:hypothetical protein
MRVNDFLHHFGFLVLILLLGCGGLLVALARLRTRDRSLSTKRSFLDYLLGWPLLFGKPSSDDRSRPVSSRFTTRELIGWLSVLILIVLAVVFKW